ncbi:MAG TPA: response regulator [Bryobacteraceae bacterium]|jgi:PAS domain S-box-containing protein|nr:response regulator [Bryobacteraceae bacterium]
MTSTSVASLLIVDDEAAQMTALCNTLGAEGYRTTGFTSATAALAALREQTFDVVLSDLSMPDMNGIALLRTAIEIDPDIAGIVMTGYGTIDTAVKAMKAGALDYILKPFKLTAILPVLARALAVRRIRMENIRLHEAVSVYKLSMAIAFDFDCDAVIRKVADAALGHRGVRGISILLPTENRAEVHVVWAGGEAASPAAGARIPVTPALSDWVERTCELLSRSDETGEVPAAPGSPFGETLRGLSIPMLAGGKLVGILNFSLDFSNRPISPGQVKVLNILACAAASAIERASLLDLLRQAEQRYRRLTENAPDIVFRYELQPRPCYTYVNPIVRSITGYSPEEYYRDPDLGLKIAHTEDRQLMEEVLRGDSRAGSAVTLRCFHKDGGVIWMEQHNTLIQDQDGRPMAIEGIARDITERKRLEEELRHAQKMEAIGRLAGGVAHDFNNLLTVIDGYSDLSLKQVPAGSPICENLRQIRKAGEQAAILTRQLLAFGRKQVLHPKVMNLNAVIETNVKILRRIIGADIELVTRLDANPGSVKADDGQIEQILMNLVVNSRDAMPQGGQVIVETRNMPIDYSAGHGPRIMLSVTDSGSGMDATTQSRIFEPFFTTKELGRGTGLGLSIVYGAVKQSNGKIEVDSQPGKGTTFRIYLPRTEEAITNPESARSAATTFAGSETILLVEDNAAVRQLICAALEKAGYKVLSARDGAQALQISDQHGDDPALVLTDLVMPGMSGPVLVEALRDRRPALKVVYISGYVDDTLIQYGHLDPTIPLLHKPFTADVLLRHIREELDRDRYSVLSAKRLASPGSA